LDEAEHMVCEVDNFVIVMGGGVASSGMTTREITSKERLSGMDEKLVFYPTIKGMNGKPGVYSEMPTNPTRIDDEVPNGPDGHAFAFNVNADGMPPARCIEMCSEKVCDHTDERKFCVVQFAGLNKHGQSMRIPVNVAVHDKKDLHLNRMECCTPDLDPDPDTACERSAKRRRI
jgi:hypothetical protein